MRVAMIGYGAVGAIHAAKLRTEPGVELASVYGPKVEKAAAFAAAHGVARACPSLAQAVHDADVAVICSPSAAHFAQARECLEHGVHTLVEMPACENAGEAEELARLAGRRGVRLGCAHTSRFSAPFARVAEHIAAGALGNIQEINYARYHQLRERSWQDDALLHHSAHPIDLLVQWCGGVEPRACVALPSARQPQTVALLGRLPSGGAATISVTYASRIHHVRMMIVGENHTVETDGFTYVRCDLPDLTFRGDAQETYENAIQRQDAAFLQACRGQGSFVGWEDAIKILQAIDGFRALAA